MDEKNLLLAIKCDDPEAFKKIYQRYRLKVYYFSLRFLKNKEEAEEVVQEVFIKIWNNRKQINETLSFNSYLFTIAKNHIFNLNRNKLNHQAFIDFIMPFCSETENNTEEAVISKDLENHLNNAINTLPPQRKKIFKKSREEGLTYPQIASELNISEKTVESQIRLAIKWLKGQTR
jgi:RNA polymerase sigma-70 factor (ECF subfamily)